MSARECVLGIVLAAGEGTRLDPLTAERAKPAAPFGGRYRIVDLPSISTSRASNRATSAPGSHTRCAGA